MMRLETKFIEFMPNQIQDNILYVSMEYGTIIHNCACGCGNEVNTPLGPNEWHLQYNGDVISLSPSVGNWSFPCKSHYWIKKGKIVWANSWDNDQIEEVRKEEIHSRKEYYKSNQKYIEEIAREKETENKVKFEKRSWLSKLIAWTTSILIFNRK